MMNNQRQTANPQPIVALYSRLSREDSLDGDSLSIKNQRQILEDYANKQGFSNFRHYADDGTTGTRFDREQWQALIADVEAGNVSILCVKDMSRLGRDHVQVGMYLELFRQKGVRFIAISNNIDSNNPESLEFAPFINIMSEWFARDTSRKIKTVAHARGNAGKPLSYNAVFGYKKSAEDKHRWEIDEPAAEVVRRIFRMAMDGMGPTQIAKVLHSEKIEKPSVYIDRTRRIGDKASLVDVSSPYTWRDSTVAGILRKEEYCGHVVNFRTYKESYKDKRAKWNNTEDRKIFYNVHEPIIEQEVFDTVQKLRGTPRRMDNLGEANPLTGLVFCKDCGAKLYNHRPSKQHYDEHRHDKVYKHKTSDHYSCSTHKLSFIHYDRSCSAHFIRTSVIREFVLDAIRKISGYVNQNQAEFTEKIREASAVKQAQAAKAHKKQLAQNERRIAELDRLFQKIYEDNANLKLSDERYNQLSGAYEQEQRELKSQSEGLQAELDIFTVDSQKADNFIGVVRRYTVFDELTTPMLHEYVDKILVHEADKSTGERVQEVEIYFNFIGNFQVPAEDAPPTAEELAALEKRRQKLAKQREANRRHYAKKTAEIQWQKTVAGGEVSQEEIDAHNQAKLEQEQAENAKKEQRAIERREYARQWARNKKDAELAAKGGKSPRALRQDEFKLMNEEQQREEKRKAKNEWQRNYRARKKAEQSENLIAG